MNKISSSSNHFSLKLDLKPINMAKLKKDELNKKLH